MSTSAANASLSLVPTNGVPPLEDWFHSEGIFVDFTSSLSPDKPSPKELADDCLKATMLSNLC